MISDHKLLSDTRAWEQLGERQIREHRWQASLDRTLAVLQRTRIEAQAARKSAAWKLAIARWMKDAILVQTRWLAHALFLGAPSDLSRNVATYRQCFQSTDPSWRTLISV